MISLADRGALLAALAKPLPADLHTIPADSDDSGIVAMCRRYGGQP